MTTFGIVAGHGGTPTDLHQLSAPLFWRYEFGVQDSWFQARELTGDTKYKLIGKPRVQWVLEVVTQAEWDYLRTNYFTAESNLLTIRTRKRSASGAAFTKFNCTGHWLSLEGGSDDLMLPGGFWRLTLEFINLVEIA